MSVIYDARIGGFSYIFYKLIYVVDKIVFSALQAHWVSKMQIS